MLRRLCIHYQRWDTVSVRDVLLVQSNCYQQLLYYFICAVHVQNIIHCKFRFSETAEGDCSFVQNVLGEHSYSSLLSLSSFVVGVHFVLSWADSSAPLLVQHRQGREEKWLGISSTFCSILLHFISSLLTIAEGKAWWYAAVRKNESECVRENIIKQKQKQGQ